MDRFYHYFDPFPSFSAFRGFLSVCPLYSPVWLSIFLIIAGIIRTFAVSFIPRITTFNGMDMGIKEIEVEIQELELNERASLAKWIVESLDELMQDKVDTLWAAIS